MFKGATSFRVTLSAVAAAVVLAACGGGGGGDPVPVNPPGDGVGQNPGGTPVALSWNQTGAEQQVYHTMATSADGQVVLAGGLPGTLYVSRDGGANWTAAPGVPTGDPNGRWIAVDVSANGQFMVAVAYGGALWRSTDGGTTWTQLDPDLTTAGANYSYESVTISDDGQRIVAAIGPGRLWVSTNGGTTFVNPTGVPASSPWRAVDSSADGSVVVAANHDGQFFVSTNAGTSFTQVPVAVGGTAVPDAWYRVALSRDGSTVALAGNQRWGLGVTPNANRSTGLYVGNNVGGTWTFNQGSTVAGNYGSVTMSANGDVIVASLYDPTETGAAAGQVLLSNNHGVSFTQLAVPSGPTNWRAAALAGNASRLYLASGEFVSATTGNVYVSSGSVTGQ